MTTGPSAGKSRKSITLCIAQARPGTCGTCRHANLQTVDFKEGRVYCGWDQRQRAVAYSCDLALQLPTDAALKTYARYYRYEPFDGHNGTWGVLEDARFVAVDAAPELKARMGAAPTPDGKE